MEGKDSLCGSGDIAHAPLSRIVLCAPDVKSFTWANTNSFSTGLLVSVCNQHSVVVRRDEHLSLPASELFKLDCDFEESFLSALFVLDTEPFELGVVTLKTTLVILQREPGTVRAQECHREKPRKEPVQFAVLMSDFSIPRTSVFIPRQANAPALCCNYNNEVSLERDWYILPYLCSDDLRLGIHSDDCVYMTLNTARKFSLFPDSYLEIESTANTTKMESCKAGIREDSSLINASTKHRRIVKVKILHSKELSGKFSSIQNENVQRDDVVILTSILMFNMGLLQSHGHPIVNPSVENIIKFRKFSPQLTYRSSESASSCRSLQYAMEAHIACITSPQYINPISLKSALENYFCTPRALLLNDIVALPMHLDPELSDQQDPAHTVYFLVKKLLPKNALSNQTYLIDTEHTTLFQDEPCQGFAPHRHVTRLPVTHILASHLSTLVSIVKPAIVRWSQNMDTVQSVLIHGASGSGKTLLTRALAEHMHINYYQVNCYDLCGETSSATEARILQSMKKACIYAPCLMHLHNVHAFGRDRDGSTEDGRVSGYVHECIQTLLHKESPTWPVVVVGSTHALKKMTADMQTGFLHTLEMGALDEGSRLAALQSLLSDTPCAQSLSLQKVAQRTAGFVLGDLRMLISLTKKEAYRSIMETCFPSRIGLSVEEEEVVTRCRPVLSQSHFQMALDTMQSAHSDAIGAPKIPSVSWQDVGGLAAVKSEILDTIQMPLQHPELFAAGLRRSGVLLYGPPGTGKTLLAKAVATECSLNFLSVKGPELINMYVGQSEENIREVFRRAAEASPCVIFFDELDSLAPNRGRSGDSGGVMDRVVSQLLAELDGLNKSCDVFVIGATNRPDLLDPALLRPGRFDKLLFLGVSKDRAAQLNILKALTRRFNLSCELSEVVEKCPMHMTGADFYALCSDAMLNALKRQIDKLQSGEQTQEEDVTIYESDFHLALSNLVPSVSASELLHYEVLQANLNIAS